MTAVIYRETAERALWVRCPLCRKDGCLLRLKWWHSDWLRNGWWTWIEKHSFALQELIIQELLIIFNYYYEWFYSIIPIQKT